MPGAATKAPQQHSDKQKKAQEAIGAMIAVMSGSAESSLKEPRGLLLTNNTQKVEQNKESCV